MKTIKGHLREGKYEVLKIPGLNKPVIKKETRKKWQRIINLTAKTIGVSSVIIMNIIGEPPVLYSEKLKNNLDIKLKKILNEGLATKWPDGEIFGSICILDSKCNNYNEKHKEILNELKFVIEADLRMYINQEQLKYYSEIDSLTNVYNRRKLENILGREFNRSKRSGNIFSVAIMDINKLKYINDNYGHYVGDSIIKTFAKSIKNRIRTTDYFGRWGGDEFILICPDTDKKGMGQLMKDIKNPIEEKLNKVKKNFGFSFGFSDFSSKDREFKDIIIRADKNLYQIKDSVEFN